MYKIAVQANIRLNILKKYIIMWLTATGKNLRFIPICLPVIHSFITLRVWC